jgi:hypothetical protein
MQNILIYYRLVIKILKYITISHQLLQNVSKSGSSYNHRLIVTAFSVFHFET